MPLTRRQKEVLEVIVSFQDLQGYCPSYDEIASQLKLASLATVHKHIQALTNKQYLRRGPNQSRSLEVAPKYWQERRQNSQAAGHILPAVPLLGRIAAGAPVESIAQPDSLQFEEFVKPENTYALEVRGDSMLEDHICSGDYVLVERTDSVKDGEIVVALVRGSESTLKRFFREAADMIRLQPANASMKPIYVPAADVQIQGRVLAVLRKYH